MIQANELRVGNWFNFEDKLCVHGHMQVEDGAHIDSISNNNECHPIPLTTEILERCGFEIDGAGKWERKYTRQYDDPGAGFWLWQFKGGPEYCFGVESKDGCSSVAINNIYFLHELQNTWHSITRTELNYQP